MLYLCIPIDPNMYVDLRDSSWGEQTHDGCLQYNLKLQVSFKSVFDLRMRLESTVLEITTKECRSIVGSEIIILESNFWR